MSQTVQPGAQPGATVVLPTRDGVGASCIALPAGPWPTILAFFAQRFPGLTRDEIVARMQRGDVVDASGQPVAPQRPYQAHLKLYYYRDVPDEAPLPFEETVLYQDDRLIAVDKPHFVAVTPGGRHLRETLLARLKRKLGIDTLAPMHRIDRETAGVVVFTIEPRWRGAYQDLFAQRAVAKRYQAIAPWRPELELPMTRRSCLVPATHFMRMREDPGGAPNAETHIEVLQVRGALARYRLTPLTGKKHQLRVQMTALGMPILHDMIYPVHHEAGAEDYARPLQLLADRLAFRDPVTGVDHVFESRRALLDLP